MQKNKKTLARTSVGYFPPRFYHNQFKLTNSQEAALQVAIIVICGILITALILFDLQLIYMNTK